MHCPRCGQQQISEEIKFCSRCGLPLALVSEILAHGGSPPHLAELQKCGSPRFTRRLGIKISLVWFLFLTFLLAPLAAITDAPEEVVVGLAVIGFGGSLLMLVLSFFFLSNEPKARSEKQGLPKAGFQPQYLGGNPNQTTALPPRTSEPVSDYAPPANSWKAPDTGELVPRSVTEGTTKLLQKDE